MVVLAWPGFAAFCGLQFDLAVRCVGVLLATRQQARHPLVPGKKVIESVLHAHHNLPLCATCERQRCCPAPPSWDAADAEGTDCVNTSTLGTCIADMLERFSKDQAAPAATAVVVPDQRAM